MDIRRLIVLGRKFDWIQDTPFVLTATTTGAQTLTITGLTVATDKSVVVNWGDGNSNTYTGAGARTHNYAGAGTWTVSIANRRDITLLDLQDTKISGAISSSNPMPSRLTSLFLYNMPNLTWVVSFSAPIPSTLTTLSLSTMAGITWLVSSTAPVPTGLIYLKLVTMTGITWAVSATVPMPTGLAYLYMAGVAGFSWTVSATAPMPTGLQTLDLASFTTITWAINATNPMPSGMLSLRFYNCPNITWTVSETSPMPTGLTSLTIGAQAGITWTVSTTNPMPTGLLTLSMTTVAGFTWVSDADNPIPAGLTDLTLTIVNSATSIPAARWAVNTLQHIRIENSLSTAAVNDILLGIWTNKANYTHATPTLDLLGNGNGSPLGTYQEGSGVGGEPVSGMEYAYDLAIGHYTSAGPEWTVTVCMYLFGILGDSITAVTTGWPVSVYAGYKSGKADGRNHAVAGHSIMSNMDADVLAAANDGANGIIIALGTNDVDGGDMVALQAEVEENIIELKASNPLATLYYMNILPRWTDTGGGTPIDKSNTRAAIAAACLAQSITCWDTFTTPWITSAQTTDGTHLTAAGHTAIANNVIALLP